MWNNIKSENLLYLVIDMQDKFYPLIPEGILKNAKNNILTLINMFNDLNIPCIGSEHYVKGLGHTDPEITAAWKGESFKDKVTFSCFKNHEFNDDLKQHGRKIVVVSGLETHICVLQTVIDLLNDKYHVIVLSDTCVSSTKLKWENGIELMKDAGASIMNTETLLFYLLQRVDRPEFKKLVKMLKDAQNS